MIPYVKPLIVITAVAALSGGGWMARGWFEDSKELIAITAQRALADEIRAGQAEVSQLVEKRLSELRANERVIDRGVIREIQKPIYQRVCLAPDAIRLLNDAASGFTRESNHQMPADPVSID
jgi:hypothetical protein